MCITRVCKAISDSKQNPMCSHLILLARSSEKSKHEILLAMLFPNTRQWLVIGAKASLTWRSGWVVFSSICDLYDRLCIISLIMNPTWTLCFWLHPGDGGDRCCSDRDEHYRCHRPLTSHPQLPARAKEAEVSVSIFISQLSTIRAAFDQVRRWADESLRYDTSHYQLIIDLETSLDSRKHLTSLIIDSQLSNGKNLTSWTLRVKSEWWVARCT